ncbi:MAG: hypothetical protein LLF92_00735 [Planctomycetaceae bacterium]|nr:hypothetical protein [Planctomycetaceae bacterium]
MDKKKIYESWLEKKIEIPDSFADKVMGGIFEYERRPRWFDIPRIIEIISTHAIIRNGLIVTGAVAGFLRVIYFIFMALA